MEKTNNSAVFPACSHAKFIRIVQKGLAWKFWLNSYEILWRLRLSMGINMHTFSYELMCTKLNTIQLHHPYLFFLEIRLGLSTWCQNYVKPNENSNFFFFFFLYWLWVLRKAIKLTLLFLYSSAVTGTWLQSTCSESKCKSNERKAIYFFPKDDVDNHV